MVQETRTPAFCRVCGTRLQANEFVTGFDPYTGEPDKNSNLHCPNPTVSSRRVLGVFSSVNETAHPTWSNNNGVWTEN